MKGLKRTAKLAKIKVRTDMGKIFDSKNINFKPRKLNKSANLFKKDLLSSLEAIEHLKTIIYKNSKIHIYVNNRTYIKLYKKNNKLTNKLNY
ncbi:MAG: hypothetical protein LBI70_03790 [Rickettsiales bacterium]|nr:hypothetical protein [Rickettsiales bacterium]